jgi:hypothetical protein
LPRPYAYCLSYSRRPVSLLQILIDLLFLQVRFAHKRIPGLHATVLGDARDGRRSLLAFSEWPPSASAKRLGRTRGAAAEQVKTAAHNPRTVHARHRSLRTQPPGGTKTFFSRPPGGRSFRFGRFKPSHLAALFRPLHIRGACEGVLIRRDRTSFMLSTAGAVMTVPPVIALSLFTITSKLFVWARSQRRSKGAGRKPCGRESLRFRSQRLPCEK